LRTPHIYRRRGRGASAATGNAGTEVSWNPDRVDDQAIEHVRAKAVADGRRRRCSRARKSRKLGSSTRAPFKKRLSHVNLRKKARYP